MFGLLIGAMGYAFASSLVFEDYGMGLAAGAVASMVWGYFYTRWFSKE